MRTLVLALTACGCVSALAALSYRAGLRAGRRDVRIDTLTVMQGADQEPVVWKDGIPCAPSDEVMAAGRAIARGSVMLQGPWFAQVGGGGGAPSSIQNGSGGRGGPIPPPS